MGRFGDRNIGRFGDRVLKFLDDSAMGRFGDRDVVRVHVAILGPFLVL